MGFLGRISFVFAAAVVSIGAMHGTAHANPKYAAYVIHAETGDILFDRYATERRYPASLTKMMTLYLLFEEIEAGRLSLTDELPISRRASLQPASRLGLEAGKTITVETAIEALVIRSANDVATVVAEQISGSEGRFARVMTDRARELGMRSTVFRNASGLPDSRQVTTAKDMAILSQRISQDFPQFYHYFDRDTFTYDGRTYRSHNRVAMTLDGADGLKTGYTRASGYNLATTAEREGHRLIGIVLGGRSSRTRDQHMKDIINKAFLDIGRKPTLVNNIHYNRPVPSLRPDRFASLNNGSAPIVPTADEPQTLAALAPEAPEQSAETASPAADLNLASLQNAIDSMADDTSDIEVAPIGEGDADRPNVRDWVIQVGAFGEQPQAIARIREMQETVREVAANVGREVNIADRGPRTVYRARFTRLTEREATESCGRVRTKGGECIALQVAR